MDVTLTFFDAFQTSSLATLAFTFCFCVLLGFVLWLYDRPVFFVLFAPSITFAFMILVAYGSTMADLKDLKSLQAKTMDAYEGSERFPLFPREEYSVVFNQLVMEKDADELPWYGLSHYGDILESPEYEALQQMDFLTDDQLVIFSQYIDHCYSVKAVDSVWNSQLSGYPVSKHEAQSALEFAQANTSNIQTECLMSVSALSFLD